MIVPIIIFLSFSNSSGQYSGGASCITDDAYLSFHWYPFYIQPPSLTTHALSHSFCINNFSFFSVQQFPGKTGAHCGKWRHAVCELKNKGRFFVIATNEAGKKLWRSMLCRKQYQALIMTMIKWLRVRFQRCFSLYCLVYRQLVVSGYLHLC